MPWKRPTYPNPQPQPIAPQVDYSTLSYSATTYLCLCSFCSKQHNCEVATAELGDNEYLLLAYCNRCQRELRMIQHMLLMPETP